MISRYISIWSSRPDEERSIQLTHLSSSRPLVTVNKALHAVVLFIPLSYPPARKDGRGTLMLDVLFPVIALVLLFHALRHAPAFLASSSANYGLRNRSLPAAYRLAPRAEWLVERSSITVFATTTALNPVPKRIASGLGNNARILAKRFYDAGVLFGIVGGVVGVAGAVWALARVWLAVWDEAEAHAQVQSVPVPALVRRAVTAIAQVPVPKLHTANAGLQPLVSQRFHVL